ncbi:hypothetical protein [Pseudoruegeria sp. SK021]|uniref:hypothetical protein n=1 Tax=Pseudoruegeria sp. SK021 TaxID=1933035 RepID=UPI000A221C0B|nr:hypothetical protein [Pseudoruegeria sp. SK021]OSP56466.1 hypothetical protein BV911_00435 [Pseudoruegeria sp. SK021]
MGRKWSGAVLLWGALSGGPLAAQDGLWMEVWLHEPLMTQVNAPEPQLAPFETDGCSGGMTDAWTTLAGISPAFAGQNGARPPWEPCCVAHDHAYHNAGGTTTADASAAARLSADQTLRTCVEGWAERDTSPAIETYGLTPAQLAQNYSALALAMYQAVRLGGAPCSGLPWRWGYGYPQCSPLGE